MGPKKGRSGPAAKPASAPLAQIHPADLKRAQDAYQQAKERNGKKLLDSIDRLRSKVAHTSRITILRLLLDKHELLKEYLNDPANRNKFEGYDVWLRGQLAFCSKEWEHPLNDGRMSCTLVTALAGCWRHYVAQGFLVPASDQQHILEMLLRSLNKGFNKDSWSQDWVDPRSEMITAAECKVGDNNSVFVAERTDSTYMLAAQYKQLINHYLQLHRALNGSQWQQYPTPHEVLEQLSSSVIEAGALAAEAAKATAEQPKQLDPKLVQQETLREQQLAARNEQQQTARGNRRDTDRRDRDVKRSAGKEAEDLVKDKELLAAQLAEDKLREEANMLLKHLEARLFRPHEQMDKQQQLEELEKITAHELTKISDTLKMFNNAKDSLVAEAVLENCKHQFGDVNPSEAALLSQLEGLNSSSGCVFLDEVLIADSSSGPNSRKQHTWDTLEALEEHVLSTHLSRAVTRCDSVAFDSSTNPPKLYDVYAGHFGDLLSDVDDHRVMNGVNGHVANGLLHNRKWLEALEEDCPMAKLLNTFFRERSLSEESLKDPMIDPNQIRLDVAIGFALLQLQRGVIDPDPTKLSQQEPWALLAYHTLKLLPALHTAPPVPQDFIIYHFWLTQSACIKEYQRITSADTDAYSSSTQGAVGDIIAMLQMLYEAELLQGPLLLAVQLYLIKHGSAELDVDDLAQGQYMEADKAVNRLGEREQSNLRIYLFQVLQYVFASLPCYRQFLVSLQEHVHKPVAVAVQVKSGDKAGARLSLWPPYWEQACRSASLPSEYHTPCCNEHITLRSQSEARGNTFSRFDLEGGCESFFCTDGVVVQEDDRVAQRYLVEASHVMQAQQRTGIEMGTREGLKALLDQLYLGPDRHPLMSKIGVQPAVEPNTPKRSAWDKAHTDLLIAQQLAMHRQQLAKLIEEHSSRLEASQYRLPEQEVQDRLRALFCQRVAGRQWMLSHFQQMFEQQQNQLRGDDRQLQHQLQTLGDAAEHKTNKSNKADNSKEKEKELNEKLQRCSKGIAEIDGYLVTIKNLLAEQGTEAESYPDLLRVQQKAAAGQVDPLHQMLEILCNELVNDNTNTCAQLEDALKMSRQMLFELDSVIMYHVLSARKRVLVSAWAHREVPVAVLLANESLKMELQTHKQNATWKELMEMEKEAKKAVQPQPGSKKKKKKKGPAQKPAAAKAAAAQPDSDEPEEEQQAAAADQQQQQQHEDDEQPWQQQPDGDEDEMVDITSIFNRHSKGKGDDSSSNNLLPSSTAAANSRGPKGRAAASSEATAGPASQSSRPASITAQQLRVERHIYYGGTPICGDCGDMGHKISDCRSAYCKTCKKWGHESRWCGSACSNCGRMHLGKWPMNEGCTLKRCTYCHLMGHIARECPSAKCSKCGLLGHRPSDCLEQVYACKQCHQPRYGGHECVSQPVKQAQVEQPTMPAAAAAATSESRASSRGRPTPLQQPQASGLAADGTVPFAAAHVKLMTVSPDKLAERREKLVSMLFERDGDYATSLVSSEDKQSVLARISDRDTAQILAQPNVAALLDEVYSHNQNTQSSQRRGDGASASGQPAATQSDHQQQRSGRRTSREAEQRALAAPHNRDAGDGRPPQLHPRSSVAASSFAAPIVAPQHVEAEDRPVAAASKVAGPSNASSAGDSVQAVWNAADQLQCRLQPPQQQIAPKQPHPLYAQPAAARPGAADAWSSSHQPPATATAVGRHSSQVVLDLSGPLESWMCCFKPAAVHVIEQLVSEADIKQQLLNIVAAAQEEQLVQALNAGLLPVLKQLHSSGAGPIPNSDGLLSFASLVADANTLKLPVQPRLTAAPAQEPPPAAAVMSAAALAPSLALPPHLQHISRGQQQHQPPGGMLSYPQQAAVAPPAVVHQLLGAPLALPVQQQQQQPPAADLAAVPDGNQSDSEDEMLNSLMVHDSAGASQQPSTTPVWAPAQPPQQHSMTSSEFPSLGASAPGSRVGPAVSSAGLANETGEYNCFLNVVVQCLYSCKAFREQVRALPPYQQGNPVVHALLQLFEQMQSAEQGWKPGHDRTVVNPTALREALDSATHFRRQEMNDANELIDCLFECFKAAQGSSDISGSRGVLIDSVFGLKVNEKVRCTTPGCGTVSHVVGSRWEHLVMVNSMALGYAAADARDEYDLKPEAQLDFGRLLRVLVDQEQKACDKDLGGCGKLYAPEKECEQSPRVLSLQMAWDPEISGAEIGAALEHVLEDVDISAMYAAGVANSDTTYHLSSAVAYYGQHYMAFVRNEKLNQWLIFDDASVNVVGSWEDVKRKCVNGRIQPSVLFYQAMDLAALPDRATAPPAVVWPTAAAAPGVTYHPVHGAYAAGPRPAAAAAGAQWSPGPSVLPHPMHLMQHQQHPQQQHAPHPAAHAPSAMTPLKTQHGAAAATVSGPPPPAPAAAPQHSWDTAGLHSSNENGNLTTAAAEADAAPSWRNRDGSATDAWGAPASTLYPAAAAAEVLSAPQAAAGVRPAQPRPAWGGTGRVAQVAFGNIAVQAARGEGGPTGAPGGHRAHGAARGRGRG